MNQMIYPGEFVPLLTEEEMIKALKKSDKSGVEVPVNVTELPDSYKVEVAIPGVKNENLVVFTDEHTLSVSVFKKEAAMRAEERSRKREFNYDCFERQIVMPDDADMSFVIAEYKSGILEVYVQKSADPSTLAHNRIVVY